MRRKSLRNLTHSLTVGLIAGAGSPAIPLPLRWLLCPSCSQANHRANLQLRTLLLIWAAARSFAHDWHKPYLFRGLYFWDSSWITSSFLRILFSLQFHPIYNSLIQVCWFNSLIQRREKTLTKFGSFLPRLANLSYRWEDATSTPVNAREPTKPSWEQASWLWLALLVAVSQQPISAVCETAGYFGTEHTEH